jgi:E3 ubiquitin-protein ligase SHPRH
MLAVWARYQSLLNSHDELQMCKRRLALVPAGIPKAEGEEDASLWPFELAPKYAEQYHKALAYSAELAKARGNLSFYRSQLASVRAGVPADCPICMDAIMPGAGTPAEPWTEADTAVLLTGCGHGFHKACLRHWMRTKAACPLCKVRIHSLSELQICNGPQAATTSISASANGVGSNAAISGQWGTKIDALVGDLKALCTGRPLSVASSADRDTSSDKIIVFSQWKPMLDIVAEALSHNRLSFVYCYEAAHFAPRGRLWCFQREAGLRILLLPLAYGAEGLDLTEANHVVLLEPLLNSAMEQQALGRIDRLGQVRPTFVHRYVCAGTVEEKIHVLREKGSDQSSSLAASGAKRAGKKQAGASDAADISVAQLQRLFSSTEEKEEEEPADEA